MKCNQQTRPRCLGRHLMIRAASTLIACCLSTSIVWTDARLFHDCSGDEPSQARETQRLSESLPSLTLFK